MGEEGGGAPSSARDDSVPYVSQAKAFREFLLRARRYSSLDGGKAGKLVRLKYFFLTSNNPSSRTVFLHY